MVTDCPDIDGFRALIGRDIIPKGDFALTNFNNDTYLSFRIPSITRIDYVEEAERLNFSGIISKMACTFTRVLITNYMSDIIADTKIYTKTCFQTG